MLAKHRPSPLNIWHTLSQLGLKENMPIHIRKGIVLFNQVSRIMALLILIVSSTLYFGFGLAEIARHIFGMIFILICTIFLNLKGKVHLSILIFAIAMPCYITLATITTKLNGLNISLAMYLAPKISLIITSLLPIVVAGFQSSKKALWHGVPGFICFFGFDVIHQCMGIDYRQMPFLSQHYPIFQMVTTSLFLVIIFIVIFLQNINNDYEKRVRNQRDEILKKNSLLEQQKEEITAQRDEIFAQMEELARHRNLLAVQNKNITDSIQYAKRIQQAILPRQKKGTTNLYALNNLEHFVFFKPRDIVSGDFYWARRIGGKVYVAAADCTGHGVPGAFMSMLGISFLNEISKSDIDTNSASSILNTMRKMVKSSLHQTGQTNEAKDGMDMALCIIDTETLRLQFAGAYNPLYLISKSELQTIKADKMPIGIYIREKESFTNHSIQLTTGDCIYFFSDGYADQFGGEHNQKFKSKQLKELLLSIHQLDAQTQHQQLATAFDTWKGANEQVDDVLLIGIRV